MSTPRDKKLLEAPYQCDSESRHSLTLAVMLQRWSKATLLNSSMLYYYFDLLGCDTRHSAWKEHCVLDVSGVCYPPHQALNAKSKAAMWYRAILSQIKVPIIRCWIEFLFLDALSN